MGLRGTELLVEEVMKFHCTSVLKGNSIKKLACDTAVERDPALCQCLGMELAGTIGLDTSGEWAFLGLGHNECGCPGKVCGGG